MTLLTCAMRPAKFVTQLGDARTIPEERAARGLPHGRGGWEGHRLWQQCNPVVTEALVPLTWGGPQVIYNGGCSRPGSATTTPIGGVRACPPRWRPCARTSI